MKFAYTRLITEDVSTLASFYGKLLGVSPEGNEDFAELHPQGAILAIASRQVAEKVHGCGWEAGANRSAMLEFEVDNVDAERERIGAFVTDWLQQPKEMPWGNRSMLFRDPDGNPINFFEPVAKV